ncbi:MAG: hypothetical protein KDC26_11265 [Armatimonadetes bacterium]|nr:hypothetical protein [Armatimonadota bacterium]
MKNTTLLAFLVIFAIMTGCTQVESRSIVDKNGGVEKTVVVTIDQGMAPPGSEPQKPSDVVQFVGEGWSVQTKTEQTRMILSATKKLAPGAMSGGGITLMSKGKKLVTLTPATEVSESGVTYRETLKWVGESRQSELNEGMANAQKQIASALKSYNPKPDEIDAIAKEATLELWRIVYGPSDPIFPIFLTQPIKGEREMKIKLYEFFAKRFEEKPLGAMKAEDAKTAARQIVRQLTSQELMQGSATEADPGQAQDRELISISISVTGPGEVMKHNGNYDPVEDRLTWDMFSDAAAHQEISLSATFKN